jgi:hypothetical protein
MNHGPTPQPGDVRQLSGDDQRDNKGDVYLQPMQ